MSPGLPGPGVANWSVSGLIVGSSGVGTLTTSGGGVVTSSGTSIIGSGSLSDGTVTVTGTNSRWTNNAELVVGLQGTGRLSVEAGGAVTATDGYIGYLAFPASSVTVTGANSRLDLSGQLYLGHQGNGYGTLTIDAGGTVKSAATTIGSQSSTDGTINLNGTAGARGMLETGRILKGNGTGGIAFNGGGIRAASNQPTFVSGFSAGDFQIQAGGAFIDSNSFNIGIATPFAGGGALTKIGAGTLTLTGANTYAGGTTITGGVLQIGAGGTTGSILGDVVNNAELAFNRSNAVSFSGIISGAGSVTKLGAGTLTLNGTNTYTGGTTVASGVLSVSADANLGGIAGGLQINGGVLQVTGTALTQLARSTSLGASGGGFDIVDSSNTFTVADSLSGPGALSKTGAGTLVLTGANSFTGGTTISGGTLQLGNGGTSGHVSGDVINNATLLVNRSNGIVLSMVISGSGAVRTAGAGGLLLMGENTYTGGTFVDAGSLSIGAGGTTGSIVGDVEVASGAFLVVSRSNDYLFDGVVSGGGNFVKAGSGTTTLTATHGYAGTTLVTDGALIVNGSITSSGSVLVEPGATLGGAGIVPTTVVNGGTLSPGNSPGTLTVNGNLTLNAGSTYLAEIQGAVSDRVNVTGTAALAGTLRIVPLGGAYRFNSAYSLVSAAGGRTGTFSPVDTTGTFGDGVTTTVSYTANDVLLTLAPKPLTPILPPASPTLGVTAPRNAYAIATSIDAAVANGGDPSSLFGIYNLPTASIPAAVNSLSGEIHTAAPAMAHVASDQFLRTMLDPTAAGRLGAGRDGPGAVAFSGLVRKGADQPVAPSRLDVPFYSVWGSAYGSYGKTDGNAAIGSSRRTIDDAHLATGIDVRLMTGTVAGVAVSGGRSRASLPGLIGKIDAEVFQGGLYGVTQLGPVKLGGAVSYARLENDVSRGVPALGSTLASSYATTAWSGRLQASAAVLAWNGFSLSPLAAVQATRARSPAVLEANWAGANAGALALARRSDVTSRSELGVQLDADPLLGSVPVAGYVRAAWAHYFRRDADLTASLAGLPGASFIATGAEAERNSALLSAGIMAKLSERVSLGLNLDSELSANSTRIGGSAQLRVSF